MLDTSPVPLPQSPAWHLFVPKLITVLREGYGLRPFRSDLIAGLTVAIVALPLAMALAIASGTTPDKGLLTTVIAGFLISALGGSRFQIGGPTGAFVVVVFNVIHHHGYDGLVLATLMAGVMLLIAGVARFGYWIKYIPDPVVTGFTSGIAVIIFSSQVGDIFGLSLSHVPADFIAKWAAFWDARSSMNPSAAAVAFGALGVIIGLRRMAPKQPGFLIVVAGASLLVYLLHIPVDTIGSRFGGIPNHLPAPHWPEITFGHLRELLPSAVTIAFLAGVESLLSAIVADGMTGRRHRSNCELVAQGAANIASALFGGMPATGAIARTATNIRSGARSPVAGMLHAVFVLMFILFLAPLASFIPMASLAAILVVVAWNMAEIEKFRTLMRAPRGEQMVLLLTFGLTVMVDLTTAIEAGVVVADILFMHRMSQTQSTEAGYPMWQHDEDDFTRAPNGGYNQRDALPAGVEVFRLRGPLFFGNAGRLADILDALIGPWPAKFILVMNEVPILDATGAGAVGEFIRRCRAHGAEIIICGLQTQPQIVMNQMNIGQNTAKLQFTGDFPSALALARGGNSS
ncbi:MAG: STAS domain-containing protein [Alphaproteobacteria bacterium]|nr:STAS domain-containing protein [Alphaproteobacteria bacterium]